MAPRDRTTVQSPDAGVGTPPRDDGRLSDILHVEVAKLQSDGEYIKRDLGEMRADMRDLRDRMSRIEVRVDHLPSKGFIVGVVMLALTLIGGLLTVAPKLQSWSGTVAATSSPPLASH